MPRVSQDQLDARRSEILAAARSCFARYGYEGATVRRLEEATYAGEVSGREAAVELARRLRQDAGRQ